MWEGIVSTLFVLGFLSTWLGGALLMFPFLFKYLIGPWAKTLFKSYPEMLRQTGEYMHHEFQTAGKTRLGWWGQCLVAVGTSLLMISGTIWLVLRTIARHD